LRVKDKGLKTEHWVSKVVEELKTRFRSSNFSCNTSSNLVQIPLPTGSDSSSSERQQTKRVCNHQPLFQRKIYKEKVLILKEVMLPFGVNFNNVHSLQLLEDVTGNTTAAFAEVWWATAVSLASTIGSTESTNAKTSPQVHFPCHRCCITRGYWKKKKFFMRCRDLV